jgi:hypothetical protein
MAGPPGGTANVSKLKFDTSNPQMSCFVDPETTLIPTFIGSLLPGNAGAIFIKTISIVGALSGGFCIDPMELPGRLAC